MKFSTLSLAAIVAATNATPLNLRNLFGGEDNKKEQQHHQDKKEVYLLGHTEPTTEYRTFNEIDNVPEHINTDSYALPVCKDGIKERKNWAHLSYDERKNFVDALKCMRTKESLNLDGYKMTDRIVDFIRMHQWPGRDIHWVSSFAS